MFCDVQTSKFQTLKFCCKTSRKATENTYYFDRGQGAPGGGSDLAGAPPPSAGGGSTLAGALLPPGGGALNFNKSEAAMK